MESPTAPQRVTAVVPMRHHSERIQGKNYALFAGKPLFFWIIDALLGAERIGTIAIDTDSPNITDLCRRSFPDVLVLPRPAHLRDGAIAMNDVLRNTVAQLEGDHFLQTHSTNPLLTPETIDRAVDAYFNASGEHNSLFGVTRWQTRLYDADGRAINHDPAVLARTQDLPPVFEENSNLYVFSRSTLRETGQRIGTRPRLFEIERLEALDIDDPAGWQIAEAVAKHRIETTGVTAT
ncbi:MAG: acylneuraminate cytidylyltransferase family protein [Planctomycetota bacterium]